MNTLTLFYILHMFWSCVYFLLDFTLIAVFILKAPFFDKYIPSLKIYEYNYIILGKMSKFLTSVTLHVLREQKRVSQ